MDILKQIFPYSFKAKAGLGALILHIIVYLIASSVLGFVLGLLPLVGGILSWAAGIYCTVGWILSILDYLKILK